MATTDRDALIALYRATDGAKWREKTNWDTDAHVSEWYGVRVNDQGLVVGLSLTNNNLRDAIPAQLGALKNLTWLNLSNNQLTGPIPEELGKLTAVKELYLNGHKLSGPIPKELGALSALQELRLFSNKLSGTIPPELGDLPELQRLWLNNNQLTGPIPEELGKLTAVKVLFLSGNKLSGPIPPELGKLTALEELSLFGNHLSGSIPPELGKLGTLQRLILLSNKLTGAIPAQLGALTKLTWLNLCNNGLDGHIPPQLGDLSALTGLFLTFNKLNGPIPPELGKLTALEELSLSGNHLSGRIPEELGKLTALQTLALNNNQLSGLWDCCAHAEVTDAHVGHHPGGGIPRELDDFLSFLEKLHTFGCNSNPWVEPPAAVLGESGNIPAVRSYFVGLYQEQRVVSRSLKVVLVGREDTGKTSLRRSIAAGRPAPTQWPAESTVHMTIEDTTLGGVSVRILDCAGQVAYYGLLQLFLTRRAVYLLVWDASQEGCDESGATCTTDDLQALGILPWLTALSFRLPGGGVILVGNKCDKRSGAQGSVTHAASRVESACRDWLARVCSSGGRAVEIEEGTSLTSCALPGWWAYLTSGALRGLEWISGYKMRWPCDWKAGATSGNQPPSLLDRIVRAGDNGPLRAEEMVLPQSWELALSFLRDLGDNERNDTEMVGTGTTARDRTLSREGARSVAHGMARDELFVLWKDTVRERGSSVPNPTSSLEGALTIREYEGTVLSVGTHVFLDVDWLAKVLEPLLNHKGIEDRGRARTFGNVEITEQWQENSLRKLKDKGILEQRLAGLLWPGYTEHVLAALERIGLTFPCPGDSDGGLVVPLRLPEARPLYVDEHIADFSGEYGHKSLTMHWKMPYGVPPGSVERIVSQCSHLGEASLFWRFGALVRVEATQEEGDVGEASVERSRFMLEYNLYGQELVVAVWGDLEKAAAWATLSYISTAIRDMTVQYPGLRWEAFLGCPDHPGEAMCISEAQRRGDRLVAKKDICQQCHFAGKGAAFLASELLEVLVVDSSTGVMFQRMLDRVSKVQSARHSAGGTPNASSPEAQGRSIDDQAAQQLEEISRRIISAVGRPIPEQDLKTWAANLRNLRFHMREDVNHIVAESNKNIVEAVVAAGADQSIDRERMARKLLQAVTNLGTSQSAGRRWLAREVAGLTLRIPSHAVLLPPREDESPELTDTEREATSWIQRLKDWRARGKRVGKGVASKEYRLFFLCGHDGSLAECGFEGKGYRIKCPRKWVKVGLPAVKALLIVVNVALKAFAGLSIPADGIASVGGGAWDEILSSTVEGVAEASIDAACSAVAEELGSAAADSFDQAAAANDGLGVGHHSNASITLPAPREATEMLERLVRDLSINGLKKSRGSDHPFLCFDTTMHLVDKAGQGEKWSWVRTKNVDAFTAEAPGGGGRPT